MGEDARNMGEWTPEVASATECTGLIPALTGDASEMSQRKLYAVPRARRSERSRRKQ